MNFFLVQALVVCCSWCYVKLFRGLNNSLIIPSVHQKKQGSVYWAEKSLPRYHLLAILRKVPVAFSP